MADAITAAIEGAMTESGLADTGADGSLVETVDSTTNDAPAEVEAAGDEAAAGDEGESGAVGTEASPSAAAKEAVEPVVEKKEEEDPDLTIRPGENAIPHPRVKKMVAKATEKGEVAGRLAAQTLVRERDTEITRLKPFEAAYRRIDQLADQDPERFVEAMAVANPAKWKPIQARLAGAPGVTAAKGPEAEGGFVGKPMPKPNAKLADGSMTYDEEGLASLMEWATDNAVAKAEARTAAKLEPFEKERRANEWKAAQAPKIRQQITEARAEWGDLFDEDYNRAESGQPSEIITYMNANRVPFEKACTAVLLPKLKAKLTADKTKMRTSLLAELNERPAAASGTPRAAVKAPAGSRTMEQVIADSMAAVGLK